jgi:hypothetical protein
VPSALCALVVISIFVALGVPQGLVLASQMLYHLSYNSSPLLWLFLRLDLSVYLYGPWTMILLFMLLAGAGITGACHHTQLID